MASLENFVSLAVAAEEVGMEYQALYKRVLRGKVRVERPGVRIVLIPKEEVARLKEELAGE